MKTRFLPVALAAVALTLTACGGSGSDSQPADPQAPIAPQVEHPPREQQ